MAINKHAFSIMNLGFALGICFHSVLRLAKAPKSLKRKRNISLHASSVVLVLLMTYCTTELYAKVKELSNEADSTTALFDNMAPILNCFIIPVITWLLLLRAKAFFVSDSGVITKIYYAGVVFVVLVFVAKLARAILRIVWADGGDDDSASMSLVLVLFNDLIAIPISILQITLEVVFLYQFSIGLRKGSPFRDMKLSPKSIVILVSVTAELLFAIVLISIVSYSYGQASNSVFNFTSAILSSIQIANLVEFGTEISEYMEDLRTGGPRTTNDLYGSGKTSNEHDLEAKNTSTCY
ncbi:hypothetical protein HK098_003986 [Nowakowskiella sp. JEL0407]|nr:hypothetical protein HK098_003986 [Nowakowskiella sp. JEL0407]